MNTFKNNLDLLKELDDFLYKSKEYVSIIRNDLIKRINQFLKYWKFIDEQKMSYM